jgi:exosortase A-associated hydrolase 1
MNEQALVLDCEGAPLVGILHRSEEAAQRGVLVVVGGGPQYRVGGHRQLTLWARKLAASGYPVLRFDYRGMGDSHGDFRGFEDADTDLQVAVDRLVAEVPGLQEIVLWGECDAASAILFYAHRDPRVKGVVLLNPWVRTAAVEAQAILRFYYLNRLMQPSFWRKVFSGRFNPFASAASAVELVKQSRAAAAPASAASAGPALGAALDRNLPLPDRMLQGAQRFKGAVMLVLSGRDLIAREFETLAAGSPAWQAQLQRTGLTRHDMPDADHTFSSAAQRTQVVDWGLNWLRSW